MVKIILSLLCNAVIACWTTVAVVQTVRRNKKDVGSGAHAFRYFTTLSNLLSGAAALTIVVCDALLLSHGGAALPDWAALIKYVGTVAVAVTFLTVVVFLGPSSGYGVMFANEGLFLHLIGPLLAVVSFCFLEKSAPLPWARTLLGLLPTLVYGVLYLVMVVFIGEGKVDASGCSDAIEKKGWDDFYGFDKGGKWAISMALMLIGTYALCAAILLLHNVAA